MRVSLVEMAGRRRIVWLRVTVRGSDGSETAIVTHSANWVGMPAGPPEAQHFEFARGGQPDLIDHVAVADVPAPAV